MTSRRLTPGSGTKQALPWLVHIAFPIPGPLSPRRAAAEYRPAGWARLSSGFPAAAARPQRAHGSRAQNSPCAAAPEPAARNPPPPPRAPPSPRPRAEASQPARRPAAGPARSAQRWERERTSGRRAPLRPRAGEPASHPPALVSPARRRRPLYCTSSRGHVLARA